MKKNEGRRRRRRRRSADNRSPPPRDRVFTATTHFCHHHRFPSPRGTLFSPPGRESFDPERETAARIFTSYPIAPARKKERRKKKRKNVKSVARGESGVNRCWERERERDLNCSIVFWERYLPRSSLFFSPPSNWRRTRLYRSNNLI